jgi:hypothetical protein
LVKWRPIGLVHHMLLLLLVHVFLFIYCGLTTETTLHAACLALLFVLSSCIWLVWTIFITLLVLTAGTHDIGLLSLVVVKQHHLSLHVFVGI